MSAKISTQSGGANARALLLLAACALPLSAGTIVALSPAASEAWDQYVQVESTNLQQRLNGSKPYLWLDESPDRLKKVHEDGVVISPLQHEGMKRVPSGLIHHWLGAIFIPDTRIDDVLRVVRDYPRYKDLYQPGVIESKLISKVDGKDRFSTLMVNRAFLLKSAFQTEFESSYVRVNDHRTYSFTRSTRIREIDDFGTASQHFLPDDEGSGIMWRLFSVTRYEERDGGVYIEVEAMGLTRDIPGALHWMVDPIVRRVSKGALTISLRQTEKASRSAAEMAKRESQSGTSIAAQGGGVSGHQ